MSSNNPAKPIKKINKSDGFFDDTFLNTSLTQNVYWPGYEHGHRRFDDRYIYQYSGGETIAYTKADQLFTEAMMSKVTVPPKEIPVSTEQQEIDAAVKEAIAAPRREREIARRVAAVTALENLADAEEGSVIRFSRPYGKKTYTYSAVKVGETWYVTGSYAGPSSYTHEALIEWMTTGDTIVSEVEIADAWTTVL